MDAGRGRDFDSRWMDGCDDEPPSAEVVADLADFVDDPDDLADWEAAYIAAVQEDLGWQDAFYDTIACMDSPEQFNAGDPIMSIGVIYFTTQRLAYASIFIYTSETGSEQPVTWQMHHVSFGSGEQAWIKAARAILVFTRIALQAGAELKIRDESVYGDLSQYHLRRKNIDFTYPNQVALKSVN